MEKLLSYVNGLPTVEQTGFAIRCGTTIGYMRKAISKGQKFGIDLCINIERESGALVTCEELRPDVDWAYLRGSKRAEPEVQQPAAKAA